MILSPKHSWTPSLEIQTDFGPQFASIGCQCNLLDAPPLSLLKKDKSKVDSVSSAQTENEAEDEDTEDENTDQSDFEMADNAEPTREMPRETITYSFIWHFIIDNFRPFHKEQKYIVFESALLSLFNKCVYCGSHDVIVTKAVTGSLLRVKQDCEDCDLVRVWDSQHFVNNLPAGNIAISAAIFFSGSLPSQALRIFEFLNCACVSRRSYFRQQSQYILPSVSHVWQTKQMKILQRLKATGAPVTVCGDGRADSPGHCAKFGSYSLVEVEQNVVIDLQLVQVLLHYLFID